MVLWVVSLRLWFVVLAAGIGRGIVRRFLYFSVMRDVGLGVFIIGCVCAVCLKLLRRCGFLCGRLGLGIVSFGSLLLVWLWIVGVLMLFNLIELLTVVF